MKRIIRRTWTVAYAVGIVAALSFGASQAFGRAPQLDCWYQPPTRLGACTTGGEGECTDRCQPYGQGAEGKCLGDYPGCCVCLLR